MTQADALAQIEERLLISGCEPKHVQLLLHHARGPFSLSPEQWARHDAWLVEGQELGLQEQARQIEALRILAADVTRSEDIREHAADDLQHLESYQSMRMYYRGCVGGWITYEFHPTSVGTLIKVVDERLNRELVLDEDVG